MVSQPGSSKIFKITCTYIVSTQRRLRSACAEQSLCWGNLWVAMDPKLYHAACKQADLMFRIMHILLSHCAKHFCHLRILPKIAKNHTNF